MHYRHQMAIHQNNYYTTQQNNLHESKVGELSKSIIQHVSINQTAKKSGESLDLYLVR